MIKCRVEFFFDFCNIRFAYSMSFSSWKYRQQRNDYSNENIELEKSHLYNYKRTFKNKKARIHTLRLAYFVLLPKVFESFVNNFVSYSINDNTEIISHLTVLGK